MKSATTELDQIAKWLAESTAAVAFTGAGMSTESGIPDFRSPGGVWSKNRTVYYDEFLNSYDDRYEYWRQKTLTHVEFQAASPNSAHNVLAKWESERKIEGVITQNIDGLHSQAGSQQLWELHGTARRIGCLSCYMDWEADIWITDFRDNDRVPDCPECGGLLKHRTVSFGQALPEDVLMDAAQVARRVDLMFALGSSLVVYPAAGIPELAADNGAKLVIINNTETPLDNLASSVIRAPLGRTLAEIDRLYRQLVD